MPTDAKNPQGDFVKIILTCAIAFSVGYACLKLSLPAPFLMGSLFGVWIAGAFLPPLRPHLGMPRWFHIPVVLGLGVLIGANFNASTLTQAGEWIVTACAMLMTTALVTMIGVAFLTRMRGYPPGLAFLCAVPGGQVEVVTLAREMTDRDYVVALFHLIRVAVIFTATPLLLAFLEGGEAVRVSNIRLTAMPHVADLGAENIASLLAIALGGYAAARLIRLPLPHLLGPMLLSTFLHIAGLVAIPRVFELIMLAQLVIGGGVGARLAQVHIKTLLGYLGDGIAMSAIILGCYALAALLITVTTGTGFLHIWLAFVPGGLYEVTLLALIFGFDIAFVAFHHTVRVFLIFITLPGLAAWLARRQG